jgi:hypothetical protein
MRGRVAAFLMASALVGLGPRAASAQEMLACVSAAEQAQRLKAAGKYMQARAQLLICSRDVCPSVVRSDCTRWRGEIEGSVPTIVIRAQDPRGQDLTDVKVWIDGAPLAERIDGLPVEVDPGRHVITAEHNGSKKFRQEILVGTGDRNRTVPLAFEDLEPLTPVPIPPPAPLGPARVSPAAWVFAGVSVAAAGAGTFFLVSAIRDKNALERDNCKPNCDAGRVSTGQRKADFATVGYGAALVSAGVATYFFLTPSRPKSTTLPSREVLVTPLHGGAFAEWTERF